PQDQRAQPLSAELGRAEFVRDRRQRLPAERRIQSDWDRGRARLLGGQGDPRAIPEKAGAAGRCVSPSPARSALPPSPRPPSLRRNRSPPPAIPTSKTSLWSRKAARSPPPPTASPVTPARTAASRSPAGGRSRRRSVRSR